MNKTYSLRKRLLFFISIPVLLACIITMSVAFKSAWHEIEEVYDAQLVHSAKVLLQLVEHELIEDGKEDDFLLYEENTNLQHKYEKNIAFRVWANNRLVTQSANAKKLINVAAPPGFSEQIINNEQWRFFVFIETNNDIRIEISELYSIRYELIYELMLALIVPMLIFVPFIFFLVWRGIQNNLKPVIALSNDMDARNSNDLRLLDDSRIPCEITPLTQAINRLFQRIYDSFEREKEFTDHAAHELRTPLAAMKTQIQLLLRQHKKGVSDVEGLTDLLASVDRSTYLVEQLLLLARLQNSKFPADDTNLSECLYDVVDSKRASLQEKNIKLTLSIAEDIVIKAYANSIEIMISNLLSNAIKYSPNDTTISISLSDSGVLEIIDEGPGIAEVHQEKVFERFYRADKTGVIGSGLGLSIVKWIADANGMTITLNNRKDTNGLIATLYCK